MCCGPVYNDGPMAEPYVAKEQSPPENDGKYFQITLPKNIKWNDKAEMAGLKAIKLGPEKINPLPTSTKFFEVVLPDGEAFRCDWQAALDLAKKILGPQAATPKTSASDIEIEQKNIFAVVQLISAQALVSSGSYLSRGLASEEDAKHRDVILMTQAKKLHEKWAIPELSSFIFDIKGLDAASQLRKKVMESRQALAKAPLESSSPEVRGELLKTYAEALENYAIILKSLNEPSLVDVKMILDGVVRESQALNSLIQSPITARFQEIDIIDTTNNLLIEKAQKELAVKNGRPGGFLFAAYQEVEKRKGFVEELRKLNASPERIRLVEHIGQRSLIRLNELLDKLPAHLTKEQVTLMRDVQKGQLKLETSRFLGLVKTPKTADEIADELRPIVDNVLARALIRGSPEAYKDAQEMINQLKAKYYPVWFALCRPQEMHAMEKAWDSLKAK